MEYGEGDLPAQDRHADAAQAQAQLAIERRRIGIVQRLLGEPFADGAAQDRLTRLFGVHRAGPQFALLPVVTASRSACFVLVVRAASLSVRGTAGVAWRLPALAVGLVSVWISVRADMGGRTHVE